MSNSLTQLADQLEQYKTWVTAQKAVFESKTKDLHAKQRQIVELKQLSDELSQVNELLDKCNIASRDRIKDEIEQLTTRALRTIFGDPHILFTINFVTKRNQVEADFVIAYENEDNTVEGDILATYGGGIADIISFALRIITMELLQVKGPLILDEPGKNISEQYIDSFGKFIAQTAESFNRQVVMVTHNTRLMQFATTTVYVDQFSGKTKVQVKHETTN